jgi:uncharacterized membrane protein YfcA
LPIHTTAGATLLGTAATSLVGVSFFAIVGSVFHLSHASATVAPNWALGFLFGLGGVLGMYTGARLQRYLPSAIIEGTLTVIVNGLALMYGVRYFMSG